MIVRCHTCGGSMKEISELQSQLMYERGKVADHAKQLAEREEAIEVLSKRLVEAWQPHANTFGKDEDDMKRAHFKWWIGDDVLNNTIATEAVAKAKGTK